MIASVVSQGCAKPHPPPQQSDPVKRTLFQYAPGLQYCYEQGLKRDERLAGRVEIAWTVRDTRVSNVRVISDETGDPLFTDCMVEKIGGWVFPDTVQGDLTWPFVFNTKRRW